MVALTFPDGARRDYPQGTTGLDIAKGISPSLAKRTVAMALDGTLADLADPIERDAKIEFVSRDDPRALELIRHDAAHIMAEAVQNLWPGTQVTIGPVIENGFYYDFARNQPFTLEDLPAIEKKMKEIIARDKPFTKEEWSRDQAKKVFADKGENFKVELVDAIPQDQSIKIYKQGDWFDLCRGPHMTSTGKVGNAFKLMKVAGAYWRGDSNNPMLTRIYGTAFAKQEELDAYLKQIEEAEKRDHRRLGREMDLFHFQEEAPGSVFWHAKGWTLFQALENYIRRRQQDSGYVEVNSPQMMDRELWVTTGHIPTYSDMMFLTAKREEDERVYAIKPMNCPGHVQIFKNGLKSYRDLPLKIAEFGKVHRFEPSGALHGLMRVRAFTQDDAHIFIMESQIAEETLKVNNQILSIYEDFGFSDVRIKFSDRPDKRIGDDAVWDKAEAALMAALKASGRPWSLNKGEGAFYGPKLEYVLRDAIGREWQCGTVQVDLNLPGRLGAFYIDEHSNKVTPVMLHRAMFGSMERFTGILIEHYAGHLPLWLSPLQAVVATITLDADDYAREVIAAARALSLRVEGDLRNEKINYKVREHSLAKVPALLVVGKKEAAERLVSIRRLGSEGQQVMPLDAALKALADEAVPPDVRRAK
ncbi:MAG: threonine--tRNA ligase [Rhizobiales bacterium]|nr:threonine--tRNA ligase [Hyphomicrobiales bacterium]